MSTSAANLKAPQQVRVLKKRTLWRDAMRSFLKNRLATAGLIVILIFVFMAVFADLISPAPYYKSVLSDNLQGPAPHTGWEPIWLGAICSAALSPARAPR